MKNYYLSIDFEDTKPITYSHLLTIAFDTKTPDNYADYLKYVLMNAKEVTESIGKNIEDIDFGLHQSGCIVPFGEGSSHPFSKNLYTPTSTFLLSPNN